MSRDHGEVWTLPWDLEKNTKGLPLSVDGVRLPSRWKNVWGYTRTVYGCTTVRLTGVSMFCQCWGALILR